MRGLTVRNRIWLAPMCQYSVERRDGVPTDWHLVNLGARAQGGFGLLLTEATAVTADGRISPQDTGLWNDVQRDAWARIVDFVHDQGAAIGVQLAHAGRKASTYRGFAGEPEGSVPADDGGWPTVSSSADAFPGYDAPRAMTLDDIAAVVTAFGEAARRSVEAGFDTIEVHGAHGYLIHQFLSPLANHRTDAYGGDFEGRTRLLVEIVDAVRAAVPADMPVLVRLSATDWTEGGWDSEQTVAVSAVLKEHGVDLVDVSSGGAVHAQIPVGPGYQVPFARGRPRGRRPAVRRGRPDHLAAAGRARAVLRRRRRRPPRPGRAPRAGLAAARRRRARRRLARGRLPAAVRARPLDRRGARRLTFRAVSLARGTPPFSGCGDSQEWFRVW